MMKSWVDNVLYALRSVNRGTATRGPFKHRDVLVLTTTSTPTKPRSPTSTNGGNPAQTSDGNGHASPAAPTFLDLVTLRSQSGFGGSGAFYQAVQNDYGLGDDLDAEVREHSSKSEVVTALQDLSVLTLLQAVCHGSILSLELELTAVRDFFRPGSEFPTTFLRVLDVIPACRRPGFDRHSVRWGFAVESGASVICPSVLAQEKIGTADSRLLTVLPGSLQKDGASISGFYPDAHTIAQNIPFDIRDTALPADGSDNNIIEYFYTRDEEEACYYSVRAAGYPLRLERMFPAILDVHHYSSPPTATDNGWKEATKQWDTVPPHNTSYKESAGQKNNRIFLTHQNEAGRLLALSNSPHYGVVMCPDDDYLGAWGYAESSGHSTLIL